MGVRFHLSFLGPKHCYVASVSQVSAADYSIGPSLTKCFRLPSSWVKLYEDHASTEYISNIRGHDFLSYIGRWASDENSGNLKTSRVIINEIEALKTLGQENESRRCDQADLRLCLGPYPGSYFADAYNLGRYDWADNLPIGLSKALKAELSLRAYGKISGVAMNATGGWVMHFEEDGTMVRIFKPRKQSVQFRWGGKLPPELEKALERGQVRGAKISHMFLNHQNPDEFVLLFNDGNAHVNLHYDFKEPIADLLQLWYERALKKSLILHFTYPCRCDVLRQKEVDAIYYSRRGLFHLSRRNHSLALSYLREASKQNPANDEIRDNLCLALVATRLWKPDVILEDMLLAAQAIPMSPEQTDPELFRSQYLSLVQPRDFEGFKARLNQVITLATGNGTSHFNMEWSYELACGNGRATPIEIAPTSPDPPELDGTPIFAAVEASESELIGAQYANLPRRVSELSSEGAVSPIKPIPKGEKGRIWFYK